ncbi:cobyrinate a,c-diamide synthase [uncultured Mailhella sp.]|uniref:cobyrinate a,c-diamide synthase n=1 Tax=uncultured Mailhella sp. TaxID=1981031 RepID=UPI0025ED65BB|nr:cobyrinate a,c-diamide synthase [uncultured Mailhella sp.]
MEQARLVISGLSGGSGKTLVSLGLTRLLARRGLAVQPCKKGPDYIDYAWLALAAGRPAACLDPYFLEDAALLRQFARVCAKRPADIAVMEGNRGLFDGRDVEGTCSTAHVARLLKAPVILTMNCAKMTRTAAAIVSGIARFEPDLNLAGVLLNNVAGERHGSMLRRAVEQYTDIPVMGILPRLRKNPLPERHMGLSLDEADPAALAVLDSLADLMAENSDAERLLSLARTAPALDVVPAPHEKKTPQHGPLIGYVHDKALWFYYDENLEALRETGAELVRLSLFDDKPWPDIDGLYLGGGYPELFADEISASPHLAHIRALSLAGRPVYAECGGFMVLCDALLLDDGPRPMAGLLPPRPRFFRRPQGLGYVTARVTAQNPFHPLGSVWRGHEFHYSRCEWPEGPLPACCLELAPGTGMYEKDGIHYDGLLVRRTFACWTHLFAPAVPHWAEAFVRACMDARASL